MCRFGRLPELAAALYQIISDNLPGWRSARVASWRCLTIDALRASWKLLSLGDCIGGEKFDEIFMSKYVCGLSRFLIFILRFASISLRIIAARATTGTRCILEDRWSGFARPSFGRDWLRHYSGTQSDCCTPEFHHWQIAPAAVDSGSARGAPEGWLLVEARAGPAAEAGCSDYCLGNFEADSLE